MEDPSTVAAPVGFPIGPLPSLPTSPARSSRNHLSSRPTDIASSYLYLSTDRPSSNTACPHGPSPGHNPPSPLVSPPLSPCDSRLSLVLSTPRRRSTSSLHALQSGLARWESLLGPISNSALIPTLTSPSRTLLESRLYYNILTRRIKVNAYLRSPSPEAHACTRCKSVQEDIPHFVLDCPPSKYLWSRLYPLLRSATGLSLPGDAISLRDIIFFFPSLRGDPDSPTSLDPHALHALTVIHSAALWALWGNRNYASQPTSASWASFLERLKARITLEFFDAMEGEERGVGTVKEALDRATEGLSGAIEERERVDSDYGSVDGEERGDKLRDLSRRASASSVSPRKAGKRRKSTDSNESALSSRSTSSKGYDLATFEERWCGAGFVVVTEGGVEFEL